MSQPLLDNLLLGPLEAVNGALMIGASTGMLMLAFHAGSKGARRESGHHANAAVRATTEARAALRV